MRKQSRMQNSESVGIEGVLESRCVQGQTQGRKARIWHKIGVGGDDVVWRSKCTWRARNITWSEARTPDCDARSNRGSQSSLLGSRVLRTIYRVARGRVYGKYYIPSSLVVYSFLKIGFRH